MNSWTLDNIYESFAFVLWVNNLKKILVDKRPSARVSRQVSHWFCIANIKSWQIASKFKRLPNYKELTRGFYSGRREWLDSLEKKKNYELQTGSGHGRKNTIGSNIISRPSSNIILQRGNPRTQNKCLVNFFAPCLTHLGTWLKTFLWRRISYQWVWSST